MYWVPPLPLPGMTFCNANASTLLPCLLSSRMGSLSLGTTEISGAGQFSVGVVLCVVEF